MTREGISPHQHLERRALMLDVFNRHTFCNILSRARMHGFPGAWSGSSYRHHPCGIVRGTIKLTNDWHVDDICSIEITDGDGWDMRICTDSLSTRGNPEPQPINGRGVRVWSSGRWESEEARERIEPIVRKILEQAQAHTLSHESWNAAIETHAQWCRQQAHRRSLDAALAKAVAA
jgi:hypothetical protein